MPFYDKATQRLFPYRCVLEYEFDEEGSNRMPNLGEWARIHSYEKAIAHALAEKRAGTLTLSLVSDGLVQIICYVKDELTGTTLVPISLPPEPIAPSARRPVIVRFSTMRDAEWSYVLPLAGR